MDDMTAEELFRLLGSTRVNFDYHRNVRICCKCRKRAPSGEAYRYVCRGWREEDCRRLCDRCSSNPPPVAEVVREEKKEIIVMMAETINRLAEENYDLKAQVYKLSYHVPVIDHGKHKCPSCGKMTRVTTAGCDHCGLEDK